MQANRTEFRPDINGLRAIAVVAVLLFHFGVPGIPGGFAGVDVFFVISGYLIGSHLLDSCAAGTFSYRHFYTARLRRIYPALLAVSTVCLAWGWHNTLPTDYIKAVRHTAGALFFVSNQLFASELGYFDASALTKSLLHTWSLAVEGQFYVFLPLGISAVFRWRRAWVRPLIALSLAASLMDCLVRGPADSGSLFYLLLPRVWELLAGVMLASLALSKPDSRAGNYGALVGLLLIVGTCVWKVPGGAWPGYETVLPVAGAALVIAMQNPPWINSLLNRAPVQYVGSISYSLYLWHWPLLVFYRRAAASLERPLQPMEVLGLLLVSLVCAAASYHWIEQPTRRRSGFWSDRRIRIGAISGAVLTFCFGLWVVADHGIPTRLPAYVQRASQAVFLNTPRDECFRRGDSSKDAKEAFCDFGANGTAAPSVLLWGDSHANQYLSAVSDAATETGVRGLIATQSACSARLAPVPVTLPSQLACNQFNAEVWALLRQSPALKTVILGKFWGRSMDSSLADMVALSNALIAMGKKVILVGALPAPGYDVPYEWSASQIQQGRAIDNVSVTRASQAQTAAIQTALVAALSPAIQSGQLVLIDPFAKLCDNENCYLVRQGESYYRDDSHLSEAIARQFGAEFSAALRHLAN